MKRNFYTDDFEDLIREKADQYRMYPSEKVWTEINRSLHSRRNWYWSGFIPLLSGISYFAINQLMTPGTNNRLAKNSSVPAADNAAAATVIPVPVFGTVPPRNTSRSRNTLVESSDPQHTGAIQREVTSVSVAIPVQQEAPAESSISKLAPVFD